MRIAFLGTRGIPAAYGGFESCVHELSTRLSKRGHYVEVYCRSDWPESAPTEFEGVHLAHLPRLKKGFLESPFNSLVSTARAACGRSDIVHYFGCGSVPFLPISRIAGKKVVLTVDGIEWERTSYSAPARMYLRSFAELAMVYPNVTVADSRSSVDWYSRRTGITPEYIPYGTKPSKSVDKSILDKYQVNQGKYVFFAGRLVHEKGVHTLVEAFKAVKGDTNLVIVGGYPGKSEYVDRLHRDSDPRIKFLGYVYGSEYETLRNASLIHVHPSLLEGTSISLLEALGAGKCIVSSDLKENVDVGGDSMVYFKTGDPADLAARLNGLLENPKAMAENAAKASRRAAELFDWEEITDRYERIYQGLLRRN